MSDHGKIYSTNFQDSLERSTVKLAIMIALAVAVGGLVEIVPLFYVDYDNDPFVGQRKRITEKRG